VNERKSYLIFFYTSRLF